MHRENKGIWVIFALFSLVVLLIPPSHVSKSDRVAIYPMEGINEQHNFQSNYSARNNIGDLLNVKEFYSSEGNFVMDDRYLYTIVGRYMMGIDEYSVAKYNLTSGKRVWVNSNIFDFMCDVMGQPTALYNDTFYCFLENGYAIYPNNVTPIPWSFESLYAFSTKDGHVKWYYPTLNVMEDYYHIKNLVGEHSPYYPLTIGKDGTIYIVGNGKCDNPTGEKGFMAMIAVNPNGTTKWIFSLVNGSSIYNPYAYLLSTFPKGIALDKNGNIYALSTHYLYSLNKNGTLRWKLSMHFGEDGCGMLSIYKDRIYFPGALNNSWYLFAYSSEGKFLWKYKLDEKPTNSHYYFLNYFLEGFSITKDGNVHPVTQHGSYSYVYSITPNGTLKWKLKIKAPMNTPHMVVSDKNSYLYFSTSQNISEKEILIRVYKVTSNGDYKIIYESSRSVYFSGFITAYTCIGYNSKIYSIFYNFHEEAFYFYTLGNDPYAFLQSPLIISIVVIIVIPVIYFMVKKHRMKKEVSE